MFIPDRGSVAAGIGRTHEDGALRIADDQLYLAIVYASTTPRHTMPHRL